MRRSAGRLKGIEPCAAKKHSDLTLEWDQLAEERHRQIASGEDLSFEHVLVPTMLRLFESADATLVLDIGSGTGDFTARLSRVATRVVGVGPSPPSGARGERGCTVGANGR